MKTNQKKLHDENSYLPYSQRAEEEVLGSMLSDVDLAQNFANYLRDDDFVLPIHQLVFRAICSILSAGEIATLAKVDQWIGKDELYEEKEGFEYLVYLAANRLLHAASTHAEMVKDLSLKRQLIGMGQKLAENAANPPEGETGREQVTIAEEEIFRLASDGKWDHTSVKNLRQVLGDTRQLIDKTIESGTAGYSSGLPKLDLMTGGFMPSDLVVIAGRPGMGKTALALNIGFHMAQSHYLRANNKAKKEEYDTAPVLFFSLEMSSEQLGMRIISSEGKIHSNKIRRGEITANQMQKQVVPLLEKISNVPLFVDDTAGLTIGKIKSRARRLKRKYGIGVIIIDYLQLIHHGASGNYHESRVEEMSKITRELKIMAKELDVSVLALSQLSRAVEQRDIKRPILSDLRESGSIEQDADMVIFVYREEYYLQNREPKLGTEEHDQWAEDLARVERKVELILGKNRHGEVGTVNVFFEPSFTKFTNEKVADHELSY